MTHILTLSDIAGETGYTEYKSLLASDSEVKKQLWHVFTVTNESTFDKFHLIVKGKLIEKFDGIAQGIRAYNKIQ